MLNCHSSFVVVRKYKFGARSWIPCNQNEWHSVLISSPAAWAASTVWMCLDHDNRIVKYFSAMLQQKILLKLLKKNKKCWHKEENSAWAVTLNAFFGRWCLWVGTFVRLRFSLQRFPMLVATEVHWFGFGSLGGLWLWVCGWCRWESLPSRTGSEHVHIFDFATLQFRRVGTGSTYLQVNFLNPSI